MSELEPKAPLARGEEWSELNDELTLSDHETAQNNEVRDRQSQSPSNNEVAVFKDNFSDSLDDLVNSFDESLTKCFQDYDNDRDNVQKFSSIPERSSDDLLSESQ